MKKKILCFDIDGTICETRKNFYHVSKPKKKIIKLINQMYDKGYYIKIFTARFMGRSNENKILAESKGKKITINQLKKWNVKYNKLIFGKPSYDYFIDDKAFNIKDIEKIKIFNDK